MKKILSSIVLMLIICLTPAKAQLTAENYVELACPTLPSFYSLSIPYGTFTHIKWEVTNGSLSANSKITMQEGLLSRVAVFWNEAQSINGNTPSGTIKATYTYVAAGNLYTKENSFTQKVRTLKGINPPPIEQEPNEIAIGDQSVHFSLASTFYFPGKNSDNSRNEVTSYEWTLPENWIERSGHKNTFTVFNGSSIGVTTDKIKGGIIKMRGVNDCSSGADQEKSNYSTLTIKRVIPWQTFPGENEIIYGKSQLLHYEVLSVSGLEYEWSLPNGWTKYSDNGNSVLLTKSPCATDANIKVRAKLGNDVTDWSTCQGHINNPAITFSGLEERFNDINAFIDLPSEKIASLSVSGNGISPITVQNSNEITFYSTVTGNVTLNFTIKLKECGTSFSFTKDISIEELNLPISGENILCPDDSPYNYYIDNLPANINVTWNASANVNNTIRLNNTTGATCNVTALKAGDATLRATFSRGGVSIFKERGIEVATDPKVPGASAYITYTYDRDFIRLEAHTSNIYGIRGYMWNVSGTSSDSGQASYIEVSSNGNYHYNVELRVYTQCGQFFASTIVGRSYANVYPNPANQTLYINLEEQENVVSSTSSRIAKASLAAKSYDIRLFNIQGTLVRNIKSSGGEISLDVSTLPNGNYFLHIYNNQETEPQIHKIIINH